MNPPRRRRDSGFALLLVFAMAAIVGIMLYLELPRASFEAERAREEVLIRRGERVQARHQALLPQVPALSALHRRAREHQQHPLPPPAL